MKTSSRKILLFARITPFFLAICTLFSLFSATAFAEEEIGGLDFDITLDTEVYKLESPLSDSPATVEATLYFPKNFASRGGVVFGNYYASGKDCINFEIYLHGRPRLYIIENGVTLNMTFDKVNIFKGEWVHVAITWDAESRTAICYVNGEEKQRINADLSVTARVLDRIVLGGDLRDSNAQYFKGKIRDITLYSDIRTEKEIMDDFKNGEVDTSSLIAHWEMPDTASAGAVIADTSENHNDFVKKMNPNFFINEASATDYAYSFAIVGDISTINNIKPARLHYIYDWIRDNAADKNIRFMLQLGNLTEQNSAREWALLESVMRAVDGVVPYSVSTGKRDTSSHVKSAFPYYKYSDELYASYDDTVMNTARKVTVGGINYLIVALNSNADLNVLNWANEIIGQNIDHNVILAMPYLPISENTQKSKLLNSIITENENVKLVVSSQDTTENNECVDILGANGNTVKHLSVSSKVIDKENGGVGIVTMLYFSNDGKTVQAEQFSTVRGMHYKESNQFTFGLETVTDTVAYTEKELKAMADAKASATSSGFGVLPFTVIIAIICAVIGFGAVYVCFGRKKKNS